MIALIMSVCTSFAGSAMSGSPGQCMAMHNEVRYVADEAACQAEYTRQVRFGVYQYTYVGMFFDKWTTTNIIRSGRCEAV